MNISFQNFFKKSGEYFSLRKMLSFWYRHHTALFFCAFFAVLFFGAWSWYYSLYQYRLSDEEKKQYIEQNFRETVFKELVFHNVVEMLTKRTEMAETPEIKRNIFQGKGIKEKEK
jgi:NADH:ubiquinone oxidoreductase subunit H